MNFPYHPSTGRAICRQIARGRTMRQIAKDPRYPYPMAAINAWLRHYPEFRDMLNRAYRDRSRVFHDEVIDTARKTTQKSSKADRLKIDALKWGAKVGDPDSFGDKKEEGQVGPVQIVIATGVPTHDSILDVPNETNTYLQGEDEKSSSPPTLEHYPEDDAEEGEITKDD